METSKVTQVEHDICDDIPIVQELSYIKEAKVEGQSKWYRDTKKRVTKLELWLNLVNQKLTNLSESGELLEMVE